MATISDLEGTVISLLEEVNPPIFWSLQDEIRVMLVESMFQAVLITGLPEVRSTNISLPDVSVTIQDMPAAVLALLRMEYAGKVIPKATVEMLDHIQSGWENEVDTSGAGPTHWFPFGLGKIGIYPKLANTPAALTVTGSYVPIPVTTARPYDGTEPVDFQLEFQDAFSQYAAGLLRIKEGGLEFQQGISLAQFYMDKMAELSKWGYRTDDLRFTLAVGSPSRVSSVEKR